MTSRTQAGNEAAARPSTITVTLDGGLISNVAIPPELTGKVLVRVEDEDIEGLEESEIERDANGREYHLSTWP